MLIENPDAFKSWLTSILEPLCDADPAALAKYVYALVKKDKPVDELREVVVDQLDVFLQHETKPFVEMLFKSLESHEYLKHEAENEVPSAAPEEPAKEAQPLVENHLGVNPAATTSVAGPSGAGPRSGGESRGRSPPAGAIAGAAAPPRLVVNRAARLAAPAPANRHPHNEHTLVKVIPLTELLEEPVDQPPRRRDRRGDTTRDKDDRRRRRSRSWERRARARRHGRDNEHNNDVRRRPSSRSPSPRGRYRNRSPPPPAMDRQTSRSRSRSPVPRDRDHDRDRLRIPREMERDRMSRDRDHRERVTNSRDRERSRDRSRDRSVSPHEERRIEHNDAYKRRCRDFDEKGYCMRGDLCQWDHGSDPVVLEDAAAALSTVLALPAVPEYNPLTPDIWCGAGGAAFPPYHHAHHPHPPRELIPIPSVPHRIRPAPPAPGPRAPAPLAPRHAAPHKKNFDYTRFGSRPPLPANAANCSLDVKKVPRGLNDITHLNNHFSKFGKIVNIQVCYEGDPEAALITFSNPTEANIAYKSTEAVLNNRFIKVFWHNTHNNADNKQENTAPTGQQATKPTDRQNNQHPMSHNKVLINRDNIKATADNKQLEKDKEVENGIEPKKDAVKPVAKSKQIMDQHKRAQALLETQLQQQMLLIQKLESGNVTEAQRPALLQAINSAQEGIEKLRKHLMAYNDTVKQMQQAKKPKTMEEAQKEILDAELDLFNKQQEGQDVTELQNKIAELRRQMAVQFPTHIMRRPAARGGRFNTATRFTRGGLSRPVRAHNLTVNKVFNHSMNQSVDHRPRALLISGFEVDELDALVAHFSQYGEIMSKEEELSVPQLVLQYKARAHAELAAANGKHYNDRTLSITWVGNPTNSRTSPAASEPRPAPSRNGDTPQDNKEEASSNFSSETLLRFDEEEEEDADEERSWRR